MLKKSIKVKPIQYPKESIYWSSKDLEKFQEKFYKEDTYKYYPNIVCQECGSKQYSISTWHEDVCQVCGENVSCTEVRDFYYPEFEIDLNAINKKQFNLLLNL